MGDSVAMQECQALNLNLSDKLCLFETEFNPHPKQILTIPSISPHRKQLLPLGNVGPHLHNDEAPIPQLKEFHDWNGEIILVFTDLGLV